MDEGLALYFPSPASYTGEHVLELQGHGGTLVIDMLLKRLLELGCRMARPGEFSERAYLNGKIDIAQAEAIADLIDAGTAAAARAAVRSMQGEFSARVADLKQRITALRTYVEAAIDFPDEDVDFLSGDALRERLSAVFGAFESITAAARQGAMLREGINVVIAGKPNAGKVQLAEQAGRGRGRHRHRCTRHHPRCAAQAGALGRSAREPRRHRGFAQGGGRGRGRGGAARARRNRKSAIECCTSWMPPPAAASRRGAELEQLPAQVPVTLVFNKIDLSGASPRFEAGDAAGPPRVYMSALNGAGLALLRGHLKESAGYQDCESGAFAARRRHLDALGRARRHVQDAAEILSSTRAFELFAEDLRLAQQALGEITGEFTSEDLLGEIFSSFCIGK